MTAKNSEQELVAWEFEVKGPVSIEWAKHLYHAEDVPDNPEEAWRDDHEVRNIRPLVYADE